MIAPTKARMRDMISEVTSALHDYKLCWKAKSAELLVTANVPEAERTLIMRAPDMMGGTSVLDF